MKALKGGEENAATVPLDDDGVPMLTADPSALQDVTEQRQQEECIRHMARHDALTQLPNRVQFLDDMASAEAAIAKAPDLLIVLAADGPARAFDPRAAAEAVADAINKRFLDQAPLIAAAELSRLAPGVTLDEVKAKTGAEFQVAETATAG